MTMRKAKVAMHGTFAGVLEETDAGGFVFRYEEKYSGPPVSLTMPVRNRSYFFQLFPPFFEGLLPEGIMLEGLLRKLKIDRNDMFSQLVATGEDLVGAVSIQALESE